MRLWFGDGGFGRERGLEITAVRIALARLFQLLALLLWGFCPSVLSQSTLSRTDDAFLDEVQRASFRFFWEAANPETGLVKDRSRADGPDAREVASIAATGFGLTSLCIADKRQFVPKAQARARVLATLRFIAERLPQEHGFFY